MLSCLTLRCGMIGMGILLTEPANVFAQAQQRTQPSYAILQALPSVSTHQEPRVTLDAHRISIEDALTKIARNIGLTIGWSRAQVPLNGIISVSLHNVKLSEALRTILKGSGAAAQMSPDGQTITITKLVRPSTADSGAIRGTILDSATQRGISGATVSIQNTKISVVTSTNGTFLLPHVPVGRNVVVVKVFGYKPWIRDVKIGHADTTHLSIVLVPTATMLSGVVTTATGVQRKLEVGNDITTINVDSVMRVAPITSVTDLLETRVPGLTVLHSSGAPGDPSRLRLRGTSSVNGNNDPIVIVDGIRVYASQSDERSHSLTKSAVETRPYAAPSPLDQIDPNSIATIEVFKGPSASALYGADAANGVIVITTKHGHEGPTHWNIGLAEGQSRQAGAWPTHYYRFGYGVFGNGPLCVWNDLTCHVDSVVAFQALNDSRYSVFGRGSNQQMTTMLSGGTQALTYAFSGSMSQSIGLLKLPQVEIDRYRKFRGVAPPGWMQRPDNYKTWGVTGSLTAQLNRHARVQFTSGLFNSTQQRGSLDQSILEIENSYIDATQLALQPLFNGVYERATAEALTSTSGVTLDWRALPWLPVTMTAGLSTVTRTDQSLYPYGLAKTFLSNDTLGAFSIGRGATRDQTLTIGSNNIPVGQLFVVSVGANWHGESAADLTASTNELAPGITSPTDLLGDGTLGHHTAQQNTSSASTYGWYAEPRLNVHSRFFVVPGFRLDGGSASGANAGLTAFPKINMSWVASDEPYFPFKQLFQMLRLRMAFGYAGTQPGPADRLRLFEAQATSVDGSTPGSQVFISKLGNTRLRPERSSEFEGGFDAEVWNGRLSVSWTQYNKMRHDAILVIPVAASVGGGNQLQNIGVIRNTGTEVSVATQILESRAISWNVATSWSNNRNMVVRLNRDQLPNYDGGIVAGYPLFGRWERPVISAVDINHNGVIEQSEVRVSDTRTYVGQQEPRYQMNITTGMTTLHGRVSVNATFAYQNGLTQENNGARDGLALSAPQLPFNTQTALVALQDYADNIGLMETVNTFRFNTLSVSYILPEPVAKLLRAHSSSIALQGSNLGLHTNYSGKDPNVNGSSTGYLVFDNGQLPQPRTWWLRFTVGN